jgi:hypothetical protein
MAWYEGRPCAVCGDIIQKGWFWQPKPRLVAPDGESTDTSHVSDADAASATAKAILVCSSCYFNRYGDVKARAAARSTPSA